MTTLKKIIGLVLVVTIFASMAVMLSSCKKEEKEHTHKFYEAWMNDADNHWHAPACEHKTEKGSLAAHEDKNRDGICDVCSYDIKASNNNTAVNSTYTVYVKDASGQPVANVKVMLVRENVYTAYKITDSNGRATFTLEDGDWKAAFAEIPEGSANTLEQRFTFDENGQVTITLN